MDEEKQDQSRPLIPVAVVAPVWLQHPLLEFLRSTTELKLVACTVTVQILLSLDLEQTPELIIIETDRNIKVAQDQIRRLKVAWPASRIMALIPHQRLAAVMQRAGVDEVLVSGIEPDQLKQAIARLKLSDQDAPTGSGGENKP